MDAENKKPGPDPKRLKLDQDDWKEAVRKAVKGREPPEDESPEGEEEERGEAE